MTRSGLTPDLFFIMIRKQHSLFSRTFESIKGNAVAQIKGLLSCACPVCNNHNLCIMSDGQELNIYCSNCWSDFSKFYNKPETTFNISFDEYPGVDVILFGKYNGKRVYEVIQQDPKYINWLCSKDNGLESRYRHLLFSVGVDYAVPSTNETVKVYYDNSLDYPTHTNVRGYKHENTSLSDFDGWDWDDMGSLGDDEHGDWMCASEW